MTGSDPIAGFGRPDVLDRPAHLVRTLEVARLGITKDRQIFLADHCPVCPARMRFCDQGGHARPHRRPGPQARDGKFLFADLALKMPTGFVDAGSRNHGDVRMLRGIRKSAAQTIASPRMVKRVFAMYQKTPFPPPNIWSNKATGKTITECSLSATCLPQEKAC